MMKTHTVYFKLAAGFLLVMSFGSPVVNKLGAQTFTTLYSFTGDSGTLSVLSSNTLFGTIPGGPNSGDRGSLFSINTDGTRFTILYDFTGGSDGSTPTGLILSGNTLYGIAADSIFAGPSFGTVFALNADGTGFSTRYSFTRPSSSYPNINADGIFPDSLSMWGNTLYGTATLGGDSGSGTVFALNSNGTGFVTLYSFSATAPCCPLINSDGSWPASLVLSASTLYGITSSGGDSGQGTVFAINTNGTGFATLHSFTGDSDGEQPRSLVALGNTLYGTAGAGGSSGSGTVFTINTDGTGFAVLHDLNGGSDGKWPLGLILWNKTLYGTTSFGGNFGKGTLFSLNTDGSSFKNLYNFEASPSGGLLLSGNTLYGTTGPLDSVGVATLFGFSLPLVPPQLTMARSDVNVILSWPTNAVGFTLQSSSDLSSSTNWVDSTDTPTIVVDQYVLTNTVSGTARFYRLKQ